MDLCDILHYIDFEKLNACRDWAATEMIKNKATAKKDQRCYVYSRRNIERKEQWHITTRKRTNRNILLEHPQIHTEKVKLSF